MHSWDHQLYWIRDPPAICVLINTDFNNPHDSTAHSDLRTTGLGHLSLRSENANLFLSSSPSHTSLFHPPFIGTNLMLINFTASSNCQQAEQNSMYTLLMLQQKERLPLSFYLFSGRTLDVSHLLYSQASLSQLVATSFLIFFMPLSLTSQIKSTRGFCLFCIQERSRLSPCLTISTATASPATVIATWMAPGTVPRSVLASLDYPHHSNPRGPFPT